MIMDKQKDDFLKRLLATFRIEANEHLQAMAAGLIELENNPAEVRHVEIVETVFRETHSLKGAARAVNLKGIEAVCQSMESVLAALKGNRLAVSSKLFDLLQEAIADLNRLLSVEGADSGAGAAAVAGKPAGATLIQRLGAVLPGKGDNTVATDPDPAETQSATAPPAPSAPLQQTSIAPVQDAAMEAAVATVAVAAHKSSTASSPGIASGTVRVSTHKLDAVMRQVEELLVPRLASVQRAKELREVLVSFASWKKQRARMLPVLRQIERCIEKSSEKSNERGNEKGGRRNGVAAGLPELPTKELPKLLEYLESEHLFMKTIEEQLLRLSKFAANDRRILAGMSDGLLHDVKEMQLLPFSSMIEIFPRLTRELAREQGKQVELVIQGGEIEIDRRTLEEMKDPLMHLLRNCVDHGIEQPAMRQNKGKPACGNISFSIGQKDGGKIEIVLADDGAGIDADKVTAAALKLDLLSAEEAKKLSEEEAHALVFQSGISTSRIITDLSGRGLGLAIVREKVEHLGGFVALESRPGSGTTFRITLPLVLATFRGVLVRVGEQCFVIPALSIERVTRVAQQEIRTVQNRTTISFGGQVVALVNLGDVLELPRQNSTANTAAQVAMVAVVVLGTGHQRVAFQVDEILGEQEVLVKTLGRQLMRVRNIAGASVLGTGQVVAVLNVSDLLKSAVKRAASPAAAPILAEPRELAEKRSILVVEDSITSRALLKNILESAGFRVTTAVDGMDAYTTLKSGTFDLIVSDVEMPRMDGFDLAVKVRADKQLAGLPLILVTALDSREHRERGIDVGANAYIVKSSFDQSNLLEVIQRLI
ncbi:MAG: hybrid sensor histidine kinase/response regulator [Herbaspirillum sp.]|nr:hybrid sensor histidine kinase/response regulator [Herbaspirillum sp.]